jgi:hypothetical protein
MHPDPGVEPLGENDSIGKRSPEARRNGEPVLGIEVVLVETPERHCGRVLSERGLKRVGPE